MNMLRNEESYENTESAMEAVRWSLENGLRVYEYAKQSGRLPSEEEIDAVMDEESKYLKEVTNFEKLDALYKECGTTYDAFKEEMEDYGRIEIELELMSRKLREEFQFGNDTIKDKVCKNADEYYVLSVIL